MFGGLAAYFWLREDTPVSLGMQDVRMIITFCAGGLVLSSLTGMFATAEDSRALTRLYTLLIVALMVMQGFTCTHLSFFSYEERLHRAFRELTSAERHTLEIKMICCGFEAVSESPKCFVSKSVACKAQLVNAQQPVIKLLIISSVIFVVVEVVCLALAQYLASQYRKLKESRLPSSPVTSLNVRQISDHPSRHVLPVSFRNNPPNCSTTK